MKIGEFIKEIAKEDGKTLAWIAQKMGINYKTFSGKLNRGTLSADDLLKLCALLGISADKLKEKQNYDNLFISDDAEAYAIAENISEDQLLNKELIITTKVKLTFTESVEKNKFINEIYLFVHSNNANDLQEYELKLIKNVYIIDEGGQFYMEKVNPNGDVRTNRYHLLLSRLKGNVRSSDEALINFNKSGQAGNVPTAGVPRRMINIKNY
ncbi:MAG: helix-turn-helix transcriptional regulator [Trichococcus sp.]|uniref:helix-turn-helix domain-containing protein n=1 Tax=Trichococcus sp. TaxID=1985464 RepID=UPI003C64BF7B